MSLYCGARRFTSGPAFDVAGVTAGKSGVLRLVPCNEPASILPAVAAAEAASGSGSPCRAYDAASRRLMLTAWSPSRS